VSNLILEKQFFNFYLVSY